MSLRPPSFEIPEPDRAWTPPGLALPRTAYIYLAVFILTFLLPPILHKSSATFAHHHHATAEGELSEQDFEKYLSAETETRTGIEFRTGFLAKLDAIGGTAKKRKNADSYLSDAIKDYTELSRAIHVPNMDRRVLILNHLLDKPIDNAALTRLQANLHEQNVSTADSDAEVALWRRLYGPATPAQPAISRTALQSAERRIDAMRLRFLGDRALADLYHAAGKSAPEATALARLDEAAQRSVARSTGQVIVLLLAGLVGFGLLISFLVAANSGNWPSIRRVATAVQRFTWGDLLDTFLFYLAFYRVIGLIVGVASAATHWEPGVHATLLLDASMQIGTSALSAVYLLLKSRRRDTTLADIGLTTRGNLLGNIGYGILGYCATLPLTLAAGMLARLIFRHSTNTTPNPVLPLMVGTHDPISRALIFLMASIAAPLFEEFFFRGVLFSGLRLRWGWVVSGLISGACFAMLHPMQDWLPIFCMGFTFATMREMRQSLVPSMTAHFIQNTVSFIALTSLFGS